MGKKDRQIDGLIDRQKDRWMDGWTYIDILRDK